MSVPHRFTFGVMIVWFDKSSINTVTSATNARAALAALDNIITTLMNAAGQAALNAGNFKEYSYDDGQTKTRIEYADVRAISAQINALLALQQVYLQMPGMNSRVFRLIDSKNMPNFFGGCSPIGGVEFPTKQRIAAGIGYTISNNNSTLTGAFFTNAISEIDTNNQTYISGVDFSQTTNAITWVNGNTFNMGQILIAKI